LKVWMSSQISKQD